MTPEQVLDELHLLRDRVPWVTGALVATCDGFLIACDLPPDLEPDGMAALTATELSLSHRVARAVHEGDDFHEVVIRSRAGHVAIYAAGNAALAVLADPEVNLGRLHLEARPTARTIADRLPALAARSHREEPPCPTSTRRSRK
jgi:predicted regulator of Ras-like GTPase activity (Roadblock/LC7/MglB family)